jgi:hypothetical protein
MYIIHHGGNAIMNPYLRFGISVMALSAGLLMGLPADARTDCSSNQNLAQVHRRLDGAIDQLQHDQRDYDGHRVDAINDLQNARQQLVAAEQWAVTNDRDNPRCIRAYGSTGGSDVNWGTRGQRGSNTDVAYVRGWVENMIDQLQRDQRDYGGHRVAAINDMQAARAQLLNAERDQRTRRY